MKATKLFILALLVLPLGAQAQKQRTGGQSSLASEAAKPSTEMDHFDKVFQKIINTKGIEVSKSHNVVMDDKNPNRHAEATVIYDIRVGRPNFGLFKELQDAFEKASEPATLYTSFNPIDGSTRQMWSIVTRQGNDIRIGEHANSSFALAIYNEKLNETTYSNNRTVFAAEWWNTDDKNIKQGRLVRSYGEKPHVGHQTSTSLSYMSPYISNNGFSRADSLLNSYFSSNIPRVDSRFNLIGPIVNGQDFNHLSPDNTAVINIPFDSKNKNAWASMAMQNIGHLSNTDWHRLFGLLTEQVMENSHRIDSKGKEEMLVGVGLILDLCKNAPLDDEEREISAKRLDRVALEVATRDFYARDMIKLAKKRLLKQ